MEANETKARFLAEQIIVLFMNYEFGPETEMMALKMATKAMTIAISES